LTSSSPSRDEDSFCKTAMSRREDIVSCIDVTIMDRSAHRALPSPYSKIFPAFRAGAAVTHAAGLGGKRFIDLRKPHACVSAPILQHGSKCAPSGIEHRLGLSGSGESGGIYIADEEGTVGPYQTGAQLVQEIFSPMGDPGLNGLRPLALPGALRAGQGRLQVAIETSGIDRRAIVTERCEVPQSQVNAQARDRAIEDRSDRRCISRIRHCLRARHTDIQIPASAAVFTEITRAQFEVAKPITVPKRQPTSCEVDLSASITNRSDLEGNPAEGATRAAALAPGESDFLMLPAPSRIFFSNLLHRLNRQMQGALPARGSFEERPEIKSRQKPPLALEHLDRQVVAVIEHGIDFARQAAEPCGVLVLHPHAQDPDSGGASTVHPYSIPGSPPITPLQTSRNAGRRRHAALRVALSLAGLKAGVSRGELR